MILNIDCPSRYRVDREKIRAVLIRCLDAQKVEGEVEISVSLVGERKIRQLLDGQEHDVLSFPLEFDPSTSSGQAFPKPDGITLLGDIVVCYPLAVREASELGRPIADVVASLVEHGCLHLLGIHHG